MAKKELGPKEWLYPMPTTVVGAMVEGKPNYITIAHVGIMNFGTISIGMNKVHYTNQGIQENRAFSVNIPSEALVRETDYCGLVTGKNTDKSGVFTAFYGTLGVPLVTECPLNMECRLISTIDFPEHDVFVGEVVQTWCDEACLTEGDPDFQKIQPLLFTMGDRRYCRLGEPLAQAWSIGKELKGK